MLSKIFRFLWGDLTKEDLCKFGLLSGALFFIVGSYWMLRTMKNAIFIKMVGSMYLPYAKMFSVVFLICLIIFYAKLVDWLKKHKLIYVMASAYAIIFIVISFLLQHPTIGLANTVISKYRLLAWISYFVIESFGSLVVALFWSFVASSVHQKEAKKGYPVILFGAQFGSVLGNIVDLQASKTGLPWLFFVAGCCVFIVPLIIKFFMKKYSHKMPAKTEERKATGPIEGLRLLISRPYLLGILAVSTLYEIMATILDYQMNSLVDKTYHTVEQATEFLATYGLSANILALTFLFIGTSIFIRRLGLTFCLVAFPCIIALAVCLTWIHPVLWTFFGAMIAIKGFTYSLNNPAKEIMYLPTSKDVKFKAKSWIDVFGARSAKGTGSLVTASFPVLSQLLVYGSLISLGVIGFWIVIAIYVGTTNKKLVAQNQIIS
ncbi:hypothetical protein KAT08_02590 [Candidatus Babeliales bacterium]|nr:hypothetical protein [Candidatus Babeliales bacterium]